MLQAKGTFTFIDSVTGINQDGEKYFAINVMTKGNSKKKLSFVAKKPELLDKLSGTKFLDFQDVTLILDFDRLYNKEKKTSYWSVELIGIGNNGNN